MELPAQEELLKSGNMPLSIILPTYNESENIAPMLDSIAGSINSRAEIIVVDDNSPDGTGNIARQYAKKLPVNGLRVEVINRPERQGLSSAILAGIRSATGDIIVVMDGDFSHPPQTIPLMVDELSESSCDIVIASRYVRGGSVIGWPFKRRLMSKGATKIAQVGLGIQVKDPMSGFFAFKRHVINGIKFDAIGYKMLLEILVKTKGLHVKEVPYTFTNRLAGASKLDMSTMLDYVRAVWKLYRYGRSVATNEKRASIRFISKAGRFYTVGATGLLINYIVSMLFNTFVSELWYLYATILGIAVSMTSNFILNKVWTFEDKDFAPKKTSIQYGMFMGFSSLGALVQLGMVYTLYENYNLTYPLALVLGVATAAVGNFLLNKKWTFREKVWS